MNDKSEEHSNWEGESGAWAGEFEDTLSPSPASLDLDSFTWKQNAGSQRTSHSLTLTSKAFAGSEPRMQPFRTQEDADGFDDGQV